MKALAAAALALAGLVACTAGPEPRPSVTIEAIEAAVPDPDLRARWRQAYDEDRLPPLAGLPVPDQVVVAAPAASVQLAEVTPGRPRLAPGPVPDVVLVPDDQPLAAYRGPAQLIAAGPGRLVLELPEGGRRLEILFRLPEERALSAPGARPIGALEQLDLVVEDQLSPRNSLQRHLHLATPQEPAGTVLFYLSEGSDTPYARTFDAPPLTISQRADAAQASVAPAEITYAGRQLRLLPGESVRAEDQGGPVEIVLTASYAADPETSASDDGDPYHVTLMIFRLAE